LICGSYFLELLRGPSNPLRRNNLRNSSLPTSAGSVYDEICGIF
jgi:hypothetical protein